MDPARLKFFLEEESDWLDGVLPNRDTGQWIRPLLPVHILGHPVYIGLLL
jgi:hypothetical protein